MPDRTTKTWGWGFVAVVAVLVLGSSSATNVGAAEAEVVEPASASLGNPLLASTTTSTLPPAPTIATTLPPFTVVGEGDYAVSFEHPTWGPARLITRMDEVNGGSSIQVLDGTNAVRFEHVWTSLGLMGPLGSITGPDQRLGPVDGLGHIFLDVCFNSCGTTVLVPTVDGVDGAGLLGDDVVPRALADARPFDETGDGIYEIEQFVNDCVPSCADGTETRLVYRWDGTTYVADTAGATVVFPFADAFSVPQLGYEPVRGTGCGADGTLGEEIPDGWWYGFIEERPTMVAIDVFCVYFGALGERMHADCLRANAPYYENCNGGGPEWWLVNNSDRNRFMPLSPTAVRVDDGTACGRYTALIHVRGGLVEYLRYMCLGN